jgi:hypothetical protein
MANLNGLKVAIEAIGGRRKADLEVIAVNCSFASFTALGMAILPS